MSNIIIDNKQYNNVPYVTFNKVGGGTATYTEGGGGGTTITQLNVSSAGTYTAPTGTAYSPVVVPSGSEGTPTVSKGTVSGNSVTVTPSVTNTGGYISGSTKTGTGVTVSASELVSGTKPITSSGTTDVTNYASASVSSGTEGTPTATKGTVSSNSISITPSVTNTSGFISGGTHTGTAVTVSASELVDGTVSITSAGITDVTNYESASVASGSATTPATTITANPTIIIDNSGMITASVNTSKVITPTVSAGYVSSGTSGTVSVSGTKKSQLSTQAAQTITPTTTNQTIASGKYLTGAQTIVGDANLVAGNIKSGVDIFGITGSYSGQTLLGTLDVGTISTSSTSDTDTGKTITVKGIYDYDLLICQCSVNTKTNGRHVVTTRLCWLTASSNISTKSGATFATATWNVKLSSSGVATSRSNTTAYGVYAKAATVSSGNTGDNGQAVITIYQRYNNTQTGTINGTYTMRVYGVKLWNLIS